jgi:hypothetical protein
MKRSISRAICFLIVFVIMNPVIAVLCRDPEDKPKHPFLKRYRKYMVVYSPEVVLMGNSMLDEAVSRRQFEYLTGKRTLKLAKGGSASAAWYLTLKNAVFNAPTTPKMVVILFRDLYLTSPKKRVHSKYKAYIDDLSTRHEQKTDY